MAAETDQRIEEEIKMVTPKIKDERVTSAKQVDTHTQDCTDPKVGRLIKEYSFRFIVNLLNLDQETFDKYHAGSRLDAVQRLKLSETIQSHVQACEACFVQLAIQCVDDEEEEKEEEEEGELYVSTTRAKRPKQPGIQPVDQL